VPDGDGSTRRAGHRRLPGVDLRPGAVKQARLEAGLSLAKVGKGCVTAPAVYLIETGRTRPSLPTLEHIARRLGKSVEFFLADQSGNADPTKTGLIDLEAMVAEGRPAEAIALGEDLLKLSTSAHRLGIRTTSTIMYGHLETLRHRAAHIALLRDIQRETCGFTEFVPLSFVHTEAPMWQKGLVQGMRGGPTGQDVMKMYAVSRIMLNGFIPNIQVSWVKEGTRLAQLGLLAGGNDVGGTLINESISTAAGAGNGQLARPAELRRIVRDLGRVPAERSTLYTILRVFHEEPEVLEPLDDPTLDTEQFGSYARLTQASEFRFVDHRDEVTAAR